MLGSLRNKTTSNFRPVNYSSVSGLDSEFPVYFVHSDTILLHVMYFNRLLWYTLFLYEFRSVTVNVYQFVNFSHGSWVYYLYILVSQRYRTSWKKVHTPKVLLQDFFLCLILLVYGKHGKMWWTAHSMRHRPIAPCAVFCFKCNI